MESGGLATGGAHCIGQIVEDKRVAAIEGGHTGSRLFPLPRRLDGTEKDSSSPTDLKELMAKLERYSTSLHTHSSQLSWLQEGRSKKKQVTTHWRYFCLSVLDLPPILTSLFSSFPRGVVKRLLYSRWYL